MRFSERFLEVAHLLALPAMIGLSNTYPAVVTQSAPSHRRTLGNFGYLSDFTPVDQSWPTAGAAGATGLTIIERARLRLCVQGHASKMIFWLLDYAWLVMGLNRTGPMPRQYTLEASKH